MNQSSASRPRWPLVALLALAGLLAVACGGVAKPLGWAAPTIRDQVAFLSSDAGKLGAYQLSGSPRLWEFPANGNDLKLQGLYGTPSLESDTIYITGFDGSVVAISATDGSQRWQHNAGTRVIGGALVIGDSVVAGTDAGDVVALDRANGSERWRSNAGNQVWSTPVTDGTTIYVAGMDGRITAFDAGGTKRWQVKVAVGGFAGTPALRDGVLYAGSFDRRLYAVDAASGETRWRSTSAGNWFWTEPIVDGDTVLAGNLDGFVYAIDRQNGEQRWRTDVDASVRARMAVVNDVLVVPVSDGLLWGLRRDTGAQAWAPVLVGGRLFADLTVSNAAVYLASEVGKTSHRLYRVDAAAGSVTEIPLVK